MTGRQRLSARMARLERERRALEEKRRALEGRAAELVAREREARDAWERDALADPQGGDRWSEMCSYWIYVVAREGNAVTVMHAAPPCVFPQDAREETGSVGWFQSAWYGYHLHDRGNAVAGWRGKGKAEG